MREKAIKINHRNANVFCLARQNCHSSPSFHPKFLATSWSSRKVCVFVWRLSVGRAKQVDDSVDCKGSWVEFSQKNAQLCLLRVASEKLYKRHSLSSGASKLESLSIENGCSYVSESGVFHFQVIILSMTCYNLLEWCPLEIGNTFIIFFFNLSMNQNFMQELWLLDENQQGKRRRGLILFT